MVSRFNEKWKITLKRDMPTFCWGLKERNVAEEETSLCRPTSATARSKRTRCNERCRVYLEGELVVAVKLEFPEQSPADVKTEVATAAMLAASARVRVTQMHLLIMDQVMMRC